MTPHWLRVESRTACYAVAFEGDQITEHAPYARPILRAIGSRDVRKLVRYVEERGSKVTLLRGDGPCALEGVQ